MKKLLALILSALTLSLALFGCVADTETVSDDVSEQPAVSVRVAGMKGPTSIGLVEIMENNSLGNTANKYEFTLAGSADEITPKLIKGELDIAAVPANLASVLYNNTQGKIKLLAVNNLGVLYIMSKGVEINSVNDLKGKTIYTTGKGTTPEYTLRYILDKNGIDSQNDVEIIFLSEATEVVAKATAEETAVVMLPQPYATVAENKVEGLKTVIDVNEEWKRLDPESAVVTGVIVVRSDFAEKHPNEVKAFLSDFEKSIGFVNSDAEKASGLVVKHGIFENAAVIKKAIPKCNLKYISGVEMKTPVLNYLGVLYEQNPKSVGGALPKDDFFLVAE